MWLNYGKRKAVKHFNKKQTYYDSVYGRKSQWAGKLEVLTLKKKANLTDLM